MKNVFISLVCVIVCLLASHANAVVPSDTFVAALIQAESTNNDYAHGDKNLKDHAYGCLQIRKDCVEDYNSWNGTSFKAEDCLGNRELSIKICKDYIDHYATKSRLGREPTEKDMARVWNGGPAGCFDNGAIRKNGKTPKTEKLTQDVARMQRNANKYWEEKVRPLLAK